MRVLMITRAVLSLHAVQLLAIAVSCASLDSHEEARDDNQATTISSARAPIFREADHENDVNKQRNSERTDASLGSAQSRLMKELKEIYKCESHKRGIIQVELRDDNLQEWNVKLFIAEGELHEDLLKLKEMGKQDYIMLQVSFGDNFPQEPPFVRVVYPVLRGAYVSKGGSLCMELLTEHGWKSSYTIESFILTISLALQERSVRVLLPESLLEGHYSEESARENFEVMKRFHGKWGW